MHKPDAGHTYFTLGALFIGTFLVGLELAFFISLTILALQLKVRGEYFIRLALIVLVFVPLLTLVAPNESLNGTIPASEQFAIWSFYLLLSGLIIMISDMRYNPVRSAREIPETNSRYKLKRIPFKRK